MNKFVRKTALVVGANGNMGSIILPKLAEKNPKISVIGLVHRNTHRINGLGYQNLKITRDAEGAIRSASAILLCLRREDMHEFLKAHKKGLSRKAILSCDPHHTPALLERLTGSTRTAQFVPTALMTTDFSFISTSYNEGLQHERIVQMRDLLSVLGHVVKMPQKDMPAAFRLAMYPELIISFIQSLIKHDGLENGVSDLFFGRIVPGTAKLWEMFSPKEVREIIATPGGHTERVHAQLDFDEIARKISEVK